MVSAESTTNGLDGLSERRSVRPFAAQRCGSRPPTSGELPAARGRVVPAGGLHSGVGWSTLIWRQPGERVDDRRQSLGVGCEGGKAPGGRGRLNQRELSCARVRRNVGRERRRPACSRSAAAFAHRGTLPCLRFGRSSRLLVSIARLLARTLRVSAGSMTSST